MDAKATSCSSQLRPQCPGGIAAILLASALPLLPRRRRE
jgi:hypothetical protein